MCLHSGPVQDFPEVLTPYIDPVLAGLDELSFIKPGHTLLLISTPVPGNNPWYRLYRGE